MSAQAAIEFGGATFTNLNISSANQVAPGSLRHETQKLGVLKRCVPKTLAFAFGLRLRSKTRCFKTRVLGRRLPNGKPQERLRFRGLA